MIRLPCGKHGKLGRREAACDPAHAAFFEAARASARSDKRLRRLGMRYGRAPKPRNRAERRAEARRRRLSG